MQLFYSGSSNQISRIKSQNGTTQFSLNETLSDITEFNKIAFKWKTNDFAYGLMELKQIQLVVV